MVSFASKNLILTLGLTLFCLLAVSGCSKSESRNSHYDDSWKFEQIHLIEGKWNKIEAYKTDYYSASSFKPNDHNAISLSSTEKSHHKSHELEFDVVIQGRSFKTEEDTYPILYARGNSLKIADENEYIDFLTESNGKETDLIMVTKIRQARKFISLFNRQFDDLFDFKARSKLNEQRVAIILRRY